MGNLPKLRVVESRTFSHVGIDYCGPFIIREKKFRTRVGIKAYVAAFIYLAIKMHLQLVTDLSTDGFISTFCRFIAKRGPCQHI